MFYFIQATDRELPDKWFDQFPSSTQVNLPDRLYKTIECHIINNQTDDLSFLLYSGQSIQELETERLFNKSEISSDIIFYFNHEYGFIESSHSCLDDIINIFKTLISHASSNCNNSERLIIFLEGDDV